MRVLLVALTGPMLLLGGAAIAQQRPSEDEIACKLARDCGPGQDAPAKAPAGDDGSIVIADEERPFCFGGSGCGHAIKPAVATQRAVTPPRPTAAVGKSRPQRPIGRYTPPSAAVAYPAVSTMPPGRASLDMALTFPNASSDLSASSRDRIAGFAKALTNAKRASLATLSFRIEGHTNAVGTRENNLDLSRRRAQAVVDYMVTLGVAKERLEPQGLGFDDPIAGSQPTDPKNRRVEIVAK